MPAKSAKQEKFMQAVAHNPKFAKKVGVPVTVGQEFTKSKGGEMKESKKMMGKEIAFMKKKGAPKSMIKHEAAEMGAMKKGGMAMKKYAAGGSVMPSKMGAVKTAAPSRDGVATKGKTKGMMPKMAGAKGMKKGGYC